MCRVTALDESARRPPVAKKTSRNLAEYGRAFCLHTAKSQHRSMACINGHDYRVLSSQGSAEYFGHTPQTGPVAAQAEYRAIAGETLFTERQSMAAVRKMLPEPRTGLS